jgi:hypothetical protein
MNRNGHSHVWFNRPRCVRLFRGFKKYPGRTGASEGGSASHTACRLTSNPHTMERFDVSMWVRRGAKVPIWELIKNLIALFGIRPTSSANENKLEFTLPSDTLSRLRGRCQATKPATSFLCSVSNFIDVLGERGKIGFTAAEARPAGARLHVRETVAKPQAAVSLFCV